jgi:hypothetical protein
MYKRKYKSRKRKHTLTFQCPHCASPVMLQVGTQGQIEHRSQAKAQRSKYWGSGLEYMPPLGRDDALAEISKTLQTDRPDAVRSTLQRSGIWIWNSMTRTYQGIRYSETQEVANG